MALRDGDKLNFETLLKAADNGDLCLVNAVRKEDMKDVALVCAVNREGTYYTLMPLAVMVEGNPFELFTPSWEQVKQRDED